MELNQRQLKFVEEFLRTGNATNSYIAAGYSETGAAMNASRLIRNEKVHQIISNERRAVRQATWGNIEATLQDLQKVFERCMQVESVLDGKGNPTGEFKFDSRGALKAKELIGKYLGIFHDKIEIPFHNAAREVPQLNEEEYQSLKVQFLNTVLGEASAIQKQSPRTIPLQPTPQNSETVCNRDASPKGSNEFQKAISIARPTQL